MGGELEVRCEVAKPSVRKTDSICEELDRLQETIKRRAYELFRTQGSGGALSDWLSAERELVWSPAVEVRQKDNQFEIRAAVPGVGARDLEVQVAPEDVLIQADVHHEHTPEEGTVCLCEFAGGRLFRSIHLPEKIDPGSAKVEYRDGMLRLTAAIAKAIPARKIEIKAA